MTTIEMTGPQLVTEFNALLKRAAELGLPDLPKPVTRFSTTQAGVKRIEGLLSLIRAREASERAFVAQETERSTPLPEENTDVARKATPVAKPKKPARAGRENGNGGGLIQQHFDEWNTRVRKLLATSKTKIPGVKLHTSHFESVAKGKAALAKLSKIEEQLGL